MATRLRPIESKRKPLIDPTSFKRAWKRGHKQPFSGMTRTAVARAIKVARSVDPKRVKKVWKSVKKKGV